MGASHSRARPGVGPTNVKKFQLGQTHAPPATGYFILSLKGDRIKLVNAEATELKLIGSLIRRHTKIVKEGWDRHLTYSFKLKSSGRHCMIQLVADTLLSLYQLGWEPMTPIDMGYGAQKKSARKSSFYGGPQTAICFRLRETGGSSASHSNRGSGSNMSRVGRDGAMYSSNFSLLSSMGNSRESENSCLCLETYQDSYLGFHDVPNTILFDLIGAIKAEWVPGIAGVSMAVSSVICDYTVDHLPVLPSAHPDVQDEKYIRLTGKPWAAVLPTSTNNAKSNGANLNNSSSRNGSASNNNNQNSHHAANNNDVSRSCQNGDRPLMVGSSGYRQQTEEVDNSSCADQLQLAIIACLSREGYKLSMAINMSENNRVFFFIRDPEETRSSEVRIPTSGGAGLGEKGTLSVYRPMVVRSKSSFLRNYHGRTASIRKRVRASLRKKAVAGRVNSGNNNTGGGAAVGGSYGRHLSPADSASTTTAYKTEPAWWQQTSTDVSSEYEESC